MVFFKKNVLSWWQIGILLLLIFVPLYVIGPEIWPDTGGYLNFASYRPLVYPLFLWIFHRLGQYQLVVAMWMQAFLAFLTLLYISYWLYDRLKFPKFLIFFILFLVIALFDRFLVFNNILSDLIAFSFFLLTFILLVDCFSILNIKKIILLSLTTNILILTREQFCYFYLFLGALVIWHIWKQEPIKKILISSAIIIFSIMITLLVNRGYHYFANHRATSIIIPGVAIIEQALYLSNHTDHTDFRDTMQKNYFEKTIKLLEKNHLTKETMNIPGIKPFQPMTLDVTNQMYNLAYLSIIHVAKTHFPLPNFYSDDSNVFIAKLAEKLYTHNLKKNVVFSSWRIASLMGGIWFFAGFLIVLCSIFLRVIADRSWRPNIKQFFIAISIFVILGNAVIVGLFSDNEVRYFYYTYFLYFCLFGLLASELFIKRSA